MDDRPETPLMDNIRYMFMYYRLKTKPNHIRLATKIFDMFYDYAKRGVSPTEEDVAQFLEWQFDGIPPDCLEAVLYDCVREVMRDFGEEEKEVSEAEVREYVERHLHG